MNNIKSPLAVLALCLLGHQAHAAVIYDLDFGAANRKGTLTLDYDSSNKPFWKGVFTDFFLGTDRNGVDVFKDFDFDTSKADPFAWFIDHDPTSNDISKLVFRLGVDQFLSVNYPDGIFDPNQQPHDWVSSPGRDVRVFGQLTITNPAPEPATLALLGLGLLGLHWVRRAAA